MIRDFKANNINSSSVRASHTHTYTQAQTRSLNVHSTTLHEDTRIHTHRQNKYAFTSSFILYIYIILCEFLFSMALDLDFGVHNSCTKRYLPCDCHHQAIQEKKRYKQYSFRPFPSTQTRHVTFCAHNGDFTTTSSAKVILSRFRFLHELFSSIFYARVTFEIFNNFSMDILA